jgi:hypothetical protein
MARIYRHRQDYFVHPNSPPVQPADQVRCEIRGYAEKPTDAIVRLARFDRPARTRRAMNAVAIFWGAALVSIFIPVAHFFLVPGFFIYGIVAARQRLRTEVAALSAEGTCPDCGFAQHFQLSGQWSPPVETSCRQCSRRLVIAECTD